MNAIDHKDVDLAAGIIQGVYRVGNPFAHELAGEVLEMVNLVDEDEMFDEVRNHLWAHFSGGLTAANCTIRIFEALGLPVSDRDRELI